MKIFSMRAVSSFRAIRVYDNSWTWKKIFNREFAPGVFKCNLAYNKPSSQSSPASWSSLVYQITKHYGHIPGHMTLKSTEELWASKFTRLRVGVTTLYHVLHFSNLFPFCYCRSQSMSRRESCKDGNLSLFYLHSARVHHQEPQ